MYTSHSFEVNDMKTKGLLYLPVLILSLVAGVALAGDTLHGEIDAANQAFARAVLAGDTDAIMASYTDDACVIAPAAANACGSEQILVPYSSNGPLRHG